MWHPTNTPNLLRNDSGTYYARVVHLKKQHWRSLDTSVYAVAKEKLPAVEKQIRGLKVTHQGRMTFAEVAAVYESRVQLERLRPLAIEFRIRFGKTLRWAWPEVWDRDKRITELECKEWQARFENGGSVYRKHRAKRNCGQTARQRSTGA
jgi:hypothetical protein